MSKRDAPSNWERKLCKKLGVDYSTIDETHRYLVKSLPFYKKVSLFVLPPIHSSIDFIHNNVCVEGDPETEQVKITDSTEQDNQERRKEPDMAKLVEADGGSVALLNALVASLAPTGISLIRLIYKSIRESTSSANTVEMQRDIIEYLASTNSPDVRCDNSEEAASTGVFGGKKSSESLQPSNLTLPELKPSYIRSVSPPLEIRIPSSFDLLDLNQTEDMSTILAGIQIPPREERSPWENSFIEKIDFMDTSRHKMVYFCENGNEAGYTDRNLEIIKLFTAQKLQRVFDLSSEDVVCDRFEAWLVRDVLLQGHIFVTREALCFYLLLPGRVQDTEDRDPDIALHEGALGHSDSNFSPVSKSKAWAILRPRTLSIYSSPTLVYFPTKVIDLKNALYCQVMENFQPSKTETLRYSGPSSGVATPVIQSETSSFSEMPEDPEIGQKGVWFKIVCIDKVYKFQTQGIYSARHWIIALTKVIFTLRNTNVRQEAILKVPLEEVLDYHRKYVLVEEEDIISGASVELEEREKPVAFSLSYSLSAQEVSKNLEQLHLKSAIDKKVVSTSDMVNFLLFERGEDLAQVIDSVFDEHMQHTVDTSDLTLAPYNSDIQKPRVIKRNAHKRVTSTLQPEFLTGTSIFNKIEAINSEIQRCRQEQYYMYKDGKIISPNHNEPSPAEKESRVMKVLALSDRFFAHSPPEANLPPSDTSFTSDLLYDSDDETCESFEDRWDTDYIVFLPKPFTVLMFGNSGMVIMAQRRNINDVVLRYKVLLEDEENEKESATAEEYKNFDSKDSRSQKSGTLDKTAARLKLLKRSIKTVSTMGGLWSAKPEHYSVGQMDNAYYVPDSRERMKAVNRFRNYFSLGPETVLIASYFTHLKRSLPIFGRLYIANDKLCFRSLLPGVSTKMILPMKSVQQFTKGKGTESHYFRETIKVKGMSELVFEFGNSELRNDFHDLLKKRLAGKVVTNEDSQPSSSGSAFALKPQESYQYDPDRFYRSRIRDSRIRLFEDKVSVASGIDFPLILEDNPMVLTEVVTSKPYNIVLLTVGSRGDVQPYIALGKELRKEGHNVTIATHSEFKKWINKHGLQHRDLAGDPAELMQLMVTHGSLSVAFLKEAHSKFKSWISSLLETSWMACQGADLIIESPSAMSGIHVAEALGIPYLRAFTMPWTRSKAYPHAFIVPEQKRGGSYNLLTHVMFENIFWKGISGQVNAWRENTLGLPRTNLAKLQQYRIPFLYNVSPSILPPSVDFPDWVKVTGYWFLDEGNKDYKPPEDLVQFLEKAQKEKKKIIYIGFGSIVVSDASALTQTIVDAVVELDVMCILNKGWSDRLKKTATSRPVFLPPEIYDGGTIPHDWLFPRIDAAVHHGGSGTTGASLRAGLPTIIKPFFGDQFFYASRIEDLGAGVGLRNLNHKSLTKALKAVVTERKYKLRAQEVASSMSKERGVLCAIDAIYTELAYAKSLMLNIRHNTKDG